MDSEKMQKFIDHMRAAGQTDEMIAQSLIDAGNNKLAVLNMLGVSSVEELNDRTMAGLHQDEHADTRGSVHPIVDDQGNIAFKIVPVSMAVANEASDQTQKVDTAKIAATQEPQDLSGDEPKTKTIRPLSSSPRSTGVHTGLRSSSRFMRPQEKHVSPTPSSEDVVVPYGIEKAASTAATPTESGWPTIEQLEKSVTEDESKTVPEVAHESTSQPESNERPSNTHQADTSQTMVAERQPISAVSIHGQHKPPQRTVEIFETNAESAPEESDIMTQVTEDEEPVVAIDNTHGGNNDDQHVNDLNPYDETLHMLAEHKELEPDYLEDEVSETAETPTAAIPASPTHDLQKVTAHNPAEATEEMMDLEPIKRLEPVKMPIKPMPRPPIEQVPLPQEIEVTELEAIDGPAHHLKQVAVEAEKEMEELNKSIPYAIPDTPDISKLGDAARTIRESSGLKTALILVLVLSLMTLAASIGYRIYYVGL